MDKSEQIASASMDIPDPVAAAPAVDVDLSREDWEEAAAEVAKGDASAGGAPAAVAVGEVVPGAVGDAVAHAGGTPALRVYDKFYEQHGCRDWPEFEKRLGETIEQGRALQGQTQQLTAALQAKDTELAQWRAWHLQQQNQAAAKAAEPVKPTYDVNKAVHEANGMTAEAFAALPIDQRNRLNMRHYLKHPDVRAELDELYGAKVKPIADTIEDWKKQAAGNQSSFETQQQAAVLDQRIIAEVGSVLQTPEFKDKPQLADGLVAHLKPMMATLRATAARSLPDAKALFDVLVDSFKAKNLAGLAQLGQRAAEARAKQMGYMGRVARPGGGGGVVAKATGDNAEEQFRNLAANGGINADEVSVIERNLDRYGL